MRTAQSSFQKPTIHSLFGFSFIELMVSITILAIITGISIPSFATFIARNKVTTQTNALFESLYLARSYAISQQQNVHVCHLSNSDSMQCSTQRSHNTSWSNGWMVFADLNKDNEFSSDDELIHIMQSNASANVVFNQRGRLRFFPNGSARSAGFYICDQQQQNYRHLYLLHSGRARINQQLSARQKSLCDAA